MFIAREYSVPFWASADIYYCGDRSEATVDVSPVVREEDKSVFGCNLVPGIPK
jgi:hypothetical protein